MNTNQTIENQGAAVSVGSDRLLASEVFFHFKTYREARERQDKLVGLRSKGSFGIAVDKDEEAVEWQSLSRAVETSRAFLEGRQPIPECWGERSLANTEMCNEPKSGGTTS